MARDRRPYISGMAARDAKLTVEEMTPRQAKREHARLEAEIKQHDEAYYQKDAPTLRDRLSRVCSSGNRASIAP